MEIEAGTISFGTLRNEDLIPAFIDEILYYDKDNEFANHLSSVIHSETRNESEYWQSEEASFDLEELFDILDSMAPDDMYFGSHPDDPADFGFWYLE